MFGAAPYGSVPYAGAVGGGPAVVRVPGVSRGYDAPAAWADSTDTPAGQVVGGEVAATQTRSRSSAGTAAVGTDLAAGGSNIVDVEAGT
jgi:hypothetical protein